jgi:hypothetical protein
LKHTNSSDITKISAIGFIFITGTIIYYLSISFKYK